MTLVHLIKPAGFPEADWSRLLAGLNRAKRDPAALAEVRELLREHPEVWVAIGDLASTCQEVWLELVAGDDPIAQQGIRRRLGALRAELAGPAPTPLEGLLVERIVACWLHTQHAEIVLGLRLGEGRHGQETEGLRRLESAQRRLEGAIRTLATVRRLGVPSVQVNIGRRQVNIAGGGPQPLPGADATFLGTSSQGLEGAS